ncbi:MAG: MBL fold metallo-hydrolase [Candidatus Saganbacteria bacterium]|nr:MBL fold metallo-hydrolase [Candidatus Saganbacteria bacterium]
MNTKADRVNKDRAITFASLVGGKHIARHSHLLKIGSMKILIDPGVRNGDGVAIGTNALEGVNYIFLTHAHMDHVGDLVKAMEQYPNAQVFGTPATIALVAHLFRNSKLVDPSLTRIRIDDCLGRIRAVHYDREIGLGKGIHVKFLRAGHILGSASILVCAPEGNILITGDFTTQHRGLIYPFVPPDVDLRALVAEGSMIGRDTPSAQRVREQFEAKVKAALTAGRTVVVATDPFSVFQEYAVRMPLLQEDGVLPSVPIFLNERLSKVVLEYMEFPDELDIPKDRSRDLAEHFLTMGPLRKGGSTTLSGPACYFAGPGNLKEEFPLPLVMAILKAGGLLIAEEKYKGPSLWSRLQFGRNPVDQAGALMQIPATNHISGSDLRSLILQMQPRKTLLVHGLRTPLFRFAGKDLHGKAYVPGVREVIKL